MPAVIDASSWTPVSGAPNAGLVDNTHGVGIAFAVSWSGTAFVGTVTFYAAGATAPSTPIILSNQSYTFTYGAFDAKKTWWALKLDSTSPTLGIGTVKMA
jgi:hypothetical protein